MKGSSVLKKLLALYNLLLPILYAQSLPNYLSEPKSLILEYSDEINTLNSSMLRKSWISPIRIEYSDSRLSNSRSRDGTDKVWSVSIDQPIFKSGGIYNAIMYANAFEKSNSASIEIQRRALISSAVEALFNIHKLTLQIKQAKLLVANDNIDVRRKKEQYLAGVIDSSYLNQAILQRNRDKTQILALKLALSEAKSAFVKLSGKSPEGFTLPHLSLISKERYISGNLELRQKRLQNISDDYKISTTVAKYLPTISIFGRYSDEDNSMGAFPSHYRDSYYTTGIKVDLAISINSIEDIELSRVNYLKSAIELQDKAIEAREDYNTAIAKIRLIEQKIKLARDDYKLYRSLLKSTKEQARAGTKTDLDIETMRNSMNIALIDAQVYEIERQIALLKLYSKVEGN